MDYVREMKRKFKRDGLKYDESGDLLRVLPDKELKELGREFEGNLRIKREIGERKKNDLP